MYKTVLFRGNGIVNCLEPECFETHTECWIQNLLSIYPFSKSALSKQAYPGSRMGAMALLRQTYNDASWYAQGNMKNKDLGIRSFK